MGFIRLKVCCLICLTIGVCCIPNMIFAFNNEFVHQTINEHASYQSTIGSVSDSYLINVLGFSKGLDEKLNKKRIRLWLEKGGEVEDANGRPLRHFHDPLKEPRDNWSKAGLKSLYHSALIWAQSNPNSFNTNTWQTTRNTFYDALTQTSPEVREISFADTFQSVGQLMHLVSDMAVPAHVRDDAHLEVTFWDWVGVTHFEIYTRDNYNDDTIMKYDQAPKPDPGLFSQAINHADASSPISALFDINKYNGTNPEDTRNEQLIGLAEYTNANFLSEGTIFKNYNYPDISETNWDDSSLDPITVWAEDGKSDSVRYLIRDGNSNRKVASISYFWNNAMYTTLLNLDDEVYKSYASELVPKAVGYSSALLDYFFRGELEISHPEQFIYSIADGRNPHEFNSIKAKVRNVSHLTDQYACPSEKSGNTCNH